VSRRGYNCLATINMLAGTFSACDVGNTFRRVIIRSFDLKTYIRNNLNIQNHSLFKILYFSRVMMRSFDLKLAIAKIHFNEGGAGSPLTFC